MTIENYVGIDVSKLTIDVFIRENHVHKRFKNELNGFCQLVQWLQKQISHSLESVLICFEHTGLYSLPLALYLEKEGIPFAMLSALEIKRSMGITRGKNDIIDSKRIAEYAYRFKDKISITVLPALDIRKVQSLLMLRNRLVSNMKGFVVSMNETLRAISMEDFPELFSAYQTQIITLKLEIKKLEQEIKTIIKNNPQL